MKKKETGRRARENTGAPIGTPKQIAAAAFCADMGCPPFGGQTHSDLCGYLSEYLEEAKRKASEAELVSDFLND
jgi:hypothetical protein